MKTTLHFVAIAFSTLLTCASAIAQTGAPSLSTETEFQNNLTQNERYLICRTRVARDKKDRLVGTTEWIGPVSYENVAATTASLPKLFAPNTTAEK